MVWGHLTDRGVTRVEMLAATFVAGIMATVAISTFYGAIGDNNARMEAERALVDIQLARSEAIKRGNNVFLCIADAATCDVADLDSCRCKVGVPSKRYDMGWLVFVDANGNQDFDSGSEDLLWVGEPPADQIVMTSNDLIMFGFGLKASGAFSEDSGQGEIAICFDGESTQNIPGRKLVVKVTGRTEVQTMAPGESCTPGPGNGNGP